jgi:hypothetical protein
MGETFGKIQDPGGVGDEFAVALFRGGETQAIRSGGSVQAYKSAGGGGGEQEKGASVDWVHVGSIVSRSRGFKSGGIEDCNFSSRIHSSITLWG